MQSAYNVGTLEVAFQQIQQSAESLCTAFRDRNNRSELRDLALTGPDTASALPSRGRRRQFSPEIVEPVLKRDFAQFRRVGVKLLHFLDLLLHDRVTLPFGRCLCLGCHCYSLPFVLI